MVDILSLSAPRISLAIGLILPLVCTLTLAYTMSNHAKELKGSKYEELIAQNEAFYAEIKAKLSSYFSPSSPSHETDGDGDDTCPQIAE